MCIRDSSKTAIMTQLETAGLLGISRSYVSRLESHALCQLRQHWDKKPAQE